MTMTVDDPRARALLRSYRRERVLSAERGASIWRRLERSIDGGAAVRGEERPTLVPWYQRRRWIAAAAIAAGLLLALGMGSAIATRDEHAAFAPQAELMDSGREEEHAALVRDLDPAPDPELVPAHLPAPHAAARKGPASAPVGVRSPARNRRHDVGEPSAASADDLVVEVGLVRRARRALQDNDPAAALAMLDAHAHAFPAGQMLEDRLALRVEALCAVGEEARARAEAKRLQRRFPRSAHAIDGAQPCGTR
jgi:hypothetical protein